MCRLRTIQKGRRGRLSRGECSRMSTTELRLSGRSFASASTTKPRVDTDCGSPGLRHGRCHCRTAPRRDLCPRPVLQRVSMSSQRTRIHAAERTSKCARATASQRHPADQLDFLPFGEVFLQREATSRWRTTDRAASHSSSLDPGQALVETALVLPLFLTIVLGVIVLGIGLFYQQQVTNAAREAARYAAIHSATSDCPTSSRLDRLTPAWFPDPSGSSRLTCDPDGDRRAVRSRRGRIMQVHGRERAGFGFARADSTLPRAGRATSMATGRTTPRSTTPPRPGGRNVPTSGSRARSEESIPPPRCPGP